MKLRKLEPVKTDKLAANTIYYRRWTKFEKVFSIVGFLILFTGVGVVSDIIVIAMYLYCIDKVDVSPVGKPDERLLIKKTEWDQYRRLNGIDFWHQHQPKKIKSIILSH